MYINQAVRVWGGTSAATTVSRGYKTEIYGCIENVLQDSCCQAPKKNPTIIELLSEVYFSRSFGGAKPRNPNSSSKIGPPNSTKSINDEDTEWFVLEHVQGRFISKNEERRKQRG